MNPSLYPPADYAADDSRAVLSCLLPGIDSEGPAFKACLADLAQVAGSNRELRLSPEQALLTLAGFPGIPATALPAAVCRYYGDTGRSAGAQLACADPVHLRVVGDALELIGAGALEIEAGEADAVIATLNTLLADDGMHVLSGSLMHWYLAGLDGDALDTLPVSELNGRVLGSAVPETTGADRWRRLMCELQMLLHGHPVNRAREASGRLPINALWCWGGAALPSRSATPRLKVYADDAFARGLCALAAIELEPLRHFASNSAELEAAENVHLVVYDTALQSVKPVLDATRYAAVEAELVSSRVQPVCRAVASDLLAACFIDTGSDRVLRLEPAHRRGVWSLFQRFWRR